MKDKETKPLAKILFIEPYERSKDSVRKHLKSDSELHFAKDEAQALAMLQDDGPYDAVVTGGNRALLAKVRQDSPATMCILLADDADPAGDAGPGVDRVIAKDIDSKQLCEVLRQSILENTRRLHEKQLEQETDATPADEDWQPGGVIVMFDAELGTGTPEAMEVELKFVHSAAARYQRPYSVAIFDLDYQADYAAHYGQRAAKLAHKLMAEHIRHSSRSADRVYRYNADGSAILLILPETLLDGGQIMTRRVVEGFAARNVPNAKSPHGVLTLSASVACFDPADPNGHSQWSEVVDEAYLYLHVAQGQSGNTIAAPVPELDMAGS